MPSFQRYCVKLGIHISRKKTVPLLTFTDAAFILILPVANGCFFRNIMKKNFFRYMKIQFLISVWLYIVLRRVKFCFCYFFNTLTKYMTKKNWKKKNVLSQSLGYISHSSEVGTKGDRECWWSFLDCSSLCPVFSPVFQPMKWCHP